MSLLSFIAQFDILILPLVVLFSFAKIRYDSSSSGGWSGFFWISFFVSCEVMRYLLFVVFFPWPEFAWLFVEGETFIL